MEKSVKLKTVDIRNLHSIKLPDAIIASSALVYDMTLITRNYKYFKKMESLKLLNPWEQE